MTYDAETSDVGALLALILGLRHATLSGRRWAEVTFKTDPTIPWISRALIQQVIRRGR